MLPDLSASTFGVEQVPTSEVRDATSTLLQEILYTASSKPMA